MSTPIFNQVREEHMNVAKAAFSQGKIAERMEILALLEKQSHKTKQLLSLIEVLKLRDSR